MNVSEIILEKINAVGADGLCNGDAGCGCSKDEFCLMECPHLENCVLAKKVFIKDYCSPEKCDDESKEWHGRCMNYCDGYSHAVEHNETMYVPLHLPERKACSESTNSDGTETKARQIAKELSNRFFANQQFAAQR